MGRFVVMLAVLSAVASRATADPALDALIARTDAVAREVAKIRGLPLKKKIPNEVVDRDELRRRLVQLANEEKTHTETLAEGLAYARWGMIPLALDYKALLIDLLTEQIAGYYDPETKKLTLSTSVGSSGAQVELVLAHEIDHGLQDQSFDLKKFEDLPETEGDAAIARRALVEGDGIALMLEVMLARQGYGAPWSDPTVASAIEKGMSIPGTGDGLDKAPLAIRETLLFPYRAGVSFVAALRRRQPWSAVDAAFAKPPKSTEHILHPERYLAGDEPVPIQIVMPAALRGFSLGSSTVWGELGFDVFLRSHGVDADTANRAADGWGGDRAVVFVRDADRRPERAVALARLEWDSEADAIEAAEATEKALDQAVLGATVETGARTRWMGLDGTLSWVERKGPSLVIVIGAPAWAADALGAEAWTASFVKAPVKRPKKK